MTMTSPFAPRRRTMHKGAPKNEARETARQEREEREEIHRRPVLKLKKRGR